MTQAVSDRTLGAGPSASARTRLARALRQGAPDSGMSGTGLLFGCDVGGTKVQSVICDLAGTVLAEARDATPRAGGEAVPDLIARHLAQLTIDAGDAGPVLAAGIGLPGTVHPVTGDLSRAPNLPAMPSRDLRGALSARLGLPVAVENDVTLAALGECWRGHGADSAAVREGGLAFVALGTGIGMGLAWGDRMLRGARGAAGEIAWLPIGGDPADPGVHEIGALESVVAGEVLAESYRARGGTRPGTTFRELTRDGTPDPLMEEVLQELAGRVARAVLSIEAVLDPALVVFGGGIGSGADLLARVEAELAQLSPEPVACRISRLGNRAGAMGAARAAALTLCDRLEEVTA